MTFATVRNMKIILQSTTPTTTHSGEANPSMPAAPRVSPTLIKKKELAKRLSVSTRTIDNWVAKRMIPYIQVSPRFYLYEFEVVLAAIRAHYQIEPARRT